MVIIHSAVKSDFMQNYFDGLVQGCSSSIANALELLQSCTKPLIFYPQCDQYTCPSFALSTQNHTKGSARLDISIYLSLPSFQNVAFLNADYRFYMTTLHKNPLAQWVVSLPSGCQTVEYFEPRMSQ